MYSCNHNQRTRASYLLSWDGGVLKASPSIIQQHFSSRVPQVLSASLVQAFQDFYIYSPIITSHPIKYKLQSTSHCDHQKSPHMFLNVKNPGTVLFWFCFTALKFQRDSTRVHRAFLRNCRQRDFLSLFRIGHLYSVYLDILSVPEDSRKPHSVQGTLPFNMSQLFKFDRKCCIDSKGIERAFWSHLMQFLHCVWVKWDPRKWNVLPRVTVNGRLES